MNKIIFKSRISGSLKFRRIYLPRPLSDACEIKPKDRLFLNSLNDKIIISTKKYNDWTPSMTALGIGIIKNICVIIPKDVYPELKHKSELLLYTIDGESIFIEVIP